MERNSTGTSSPSHDGNEFSTVRRGSDVTSSRNCFPGRATSCFCDLGRLSREEDGGGWRSRGIEDKIKTKIVVVSS